MIPFRPGGSEGDVDSTSLTEVINKANPPGYEKVLYREGRWR